MSGEFITRLPKHETRSFKILVFTVITMTKKDYVLIGSVLRQCFLNMDSEITVKQLRHITQEFCNWLIVDNERFNP